MTANAMRKIHPRGSRVAEGADPYGDKEISKFHKAGGYYPPLPMMPLCRSDGPKPCFCSLLSRTVEDACPYKPSFLFSSSFFILILFID